MYIPGFNPYLINEFTGGSPEYVGIPDFGMGAFSPPQQFNPVQPMQPMGVLPPAAQPFQQVQAPMPALAPFPQAQQADAFSGFGGLQGFSDADFASMLSTAPGAAGRTAQRDPETGLLLGPGGLPIMQFQTSRGKAATKGKSPGFATLDPNAVYRVVDERAKGKPVVSSGTGLEGLQAAQASVAQLNAQQGKKNNWRVEMVDPTTGRVSVVADANPKKNVLGKIASVALPVGAAILTGGASIPVKIAAGAAASGLGAAAAGRDPLKGALIGGLTAGAGGLGGELGAAGKLGSIGAKTGTVIGSGLGATAGGLATGQSLGQALKGGALSSAGTFAGQQVFSGLRDIGVEIPGVNVPKNFTPGNIVVTPSGGVSIPVSTGLGGGQPKPPVAEPDSGGIEGAYDGAIDVLGNRFVPGALPFFGAGIPGLIPEGVPTTPEEVARQQAEQEEYQGEITVPGTTQTGGVPISPGLTFDDFGNLTNIDVEKAIQLQNQQKSEDRFPVVPDAPTEGGVDPEAKKRITTEEILKYLRAAGLLSAVIGGGGGGRGSLGTIPGGLGSGFSSVFSGSLPRATLPGAATGFAPRDPSSLRPQTTQDWYRYGYGPEQSFFSYVPQGEENKSKAFTGYYEGGDVSGPTGGLGMTSESFAVNGPGTGRSDEIPALLSDGEYVIDAETVALLGDGSSKAGAERLDQFRINLRRDKGRKLAKGDFSVNAKRPEQYMKGGRA